MQNSTKDNLLTLLWVLPKNNLLKRCYHKRNFAFLLPEKIRDIKIQVRKRYKQLQEKFS
jgi:hypothetical protein